MTASLAATVLGTPDPPALADFYRELLRWIETSREPGWVRLLEATDEIAGAVRSATDVDASFVHGTFSSFCPLAAVSPHDQESESWRVRLGVVQRAGACRQPITQWRLGSRPP